jgi:hypothetical protein
MLLIHLQRQERFQDSRSNRYYTIVPPRYGGNNDGFGAQYHAILSGIAFAASKDLIYVHSPLTKLAHGENVEQLNTFIGIKTSPMASEVDNPTIQPFSDEVHFSERPSQYYTPEVIKRIRNIYFTTEKPTIEANDIAVHIRRGDVMIGMNEERHTTNKEYKAIIAMLQKEYPSYTITLHSQGNLADFSDLLGENITSKLNEDIRQTFHSFVTAKVLVTAKSSLSYSAAILNEGTVYYQEFWHKPLDGWKVLNPI